MNINKAREITDAKIKFVSLVDKAANKRPFLITKADGDIATFTTLGKILKVDNDTHYVTGIVYEPMAEDAHGEFMTEDEIRKAAYWFNENGDKVDIQHDFEVAKGVSVIESYVTLADMKIGETPIAKGTWLMTAKVENPDIWAKVEKGEYTGFSMGGTGNVSVEEVDIEDSKGLLKSIAAVFGIGKGEVKEKYTEQLQLDALQSAFTALRGVLGGGFGIDGNVTPIEADREKVKQALDDFSKIVMDIATTEKLTKVGKKISGSNYAKLHNIYNELGKLLSVFEEKKEEKDQMDLNLLKQTVEAAVAEAMGQKTVEPEPKAEEIATSEDLQKMVGAAAEKLLKAITVNEGPTADEIKEMVKVAVDVAVEPLLKRAGLPHNLNANNQVEKSDSDTHYLVGVI